MTKKKNFYEELNLSRDCQQEDIRKSFIKLSKEFHPDKNRAKDAHERFVRINEAYTVLTNPLKRKLYDEQLSVTRNYDSNEGRTRRHGSYPYSNYDFSPHHYTHGKYSNTAHSGSKAMFRISLLPKGVFVAALVLVTIFISGFEIYFLRHIVEKRRKILEDKSIMASVILEQARKQAKLLGNEEQFRRLKERKLGVYEKDIIIQEYLKAKSSK